MVVKTQNTQELIGEWGNVLVPVPKSSAQMHEVGEYTIKTPDGRLVFVPPHFHHGFYDSQSGIYINRQYYVGRESLGRKVVARVKVSKKVTPRAQQHILYDVHPMPNNEDGTIPKAIYELKLSRDGNGDIEVPGTNIKLWFKER